MTMSNILDVIEPPDHDFDFVAGTRSTLTYKIVNNGEYPVRNVYFELKAVKPDGKETEKNYITLGSMPQVILSHESAEVKADIEIPLDYSETYKRKIKGEVKKVLSPFRLVYKVGGHEYIEEI